MGGAQKMGVINVGNLLQEYFGHVPDENFPSILEANIL